MSDKENIIRLFDGYIRVANTREPSIYKYENSDDISHIKKFQKERLNHFKKLNKEIYLPVNCLTINKNEVIGTNTDWMGFAEAYFQHL